MKKNFIYLGIIALCSLCFLLYISISQKSADKQPPSISFADQLLELSTQDPKEALLQGVTAQDNVDGDVTASLVVASVQLLDSDGSIQVTYAAFDAAGNVATVVRQARYTDYESPRFSLTTSTTFAYNSGFNIFNLVKATDALDGDISHRIRITSLDETSILTIGTHRVELKVTNSFGETVKLVIPVEVYPAENYDATVTLTDYLVYIPVGGQLDAESYLDEYIRAGSALALWEPLPDGYSVDIQSDVQTDVPGVYTVAYRVTQTVGSGANAKNHTGYAKLIVVVEG